jgi:hypothetical protein
MLGCSVGEALIAEPEKVTTPGADQASLPAEVGAASLSAVTPKRRDGRSLPPE